MGLGIILWSWIACTTALGTTSLEASINDKNVQHVAVEQKIIPDKTGVASFYHPKFVGRRTANGEVFSNDKFTAASNFFKLGSYVKVTNTRNGKYIYVKINDRMGHPTRVIDLTQKAARALDFIDRGVVKVEIVEVPRQEGRRQILAQNGEELIEEGTTSENVF